MSDATKQDFYTIFVNRQTYFGMPVSIHAPAWGATVPVLQDDKNRADFNPRTRVGCDMGNKQQAEDYIQFQSTHPRGVRRFWYGASLRIMYFNPRTRVGCDILAHIPGGREQISIHAPAWGATFAAQVRRHNAFKFQSTHPRGVRRNQTHEGVYDPNFNPRTRVGCDLQSSYH